MHQQINLPSIPCLFLTVKDCSLTRYLAESRRLLAFKPQILDSIEADLQQHGLNKKAIRLADARWTMEQQSLPGIDHAEVESGKQCPMVLSQGRPRMSANSVYFFWMLCVREGGIKSRAALDRIMDSKNVEAFLYHEGCSLPSGSTILENINALSEQTRSMILDAQIEMARKEALDDFHRCQVDSTTVSANVAWPKDSSTLVKLLKRLRKAEKKLKRFGLGLPNMDCYEQRIQFLKALDFQISNVHPDKVEQRKELYVDLLRHAEMAGEVFHQHMAPIESLLKCLKARPSIKVRLLSTAEEMVLDLDDLFYTIHCCRQRVMHGEKIPANQRVLSISDPDAAYIKKGKREPKIGYVAQLCRSGKGLITGFLVAQGNNGDAPILQELCKQSFKRTGVVPQDFSGDGGYASKGNRAWLLDEGVQRPSFSSSKGKTITPVEDWESSAYKKLRCWRSAVESLMSHIKGMFGFGKLVRRTLPRVKAELMDKVLAYNFTQLSQLRI